MDFPVLSMGPTAGTYKESTENAVDASKADGGYVMTRRKFTRKFRKTLSFSLEELTDADKQTLQDFWETVGGGASIFNFTAPDSTLYAVRFDSGKTLDFSFTGVGQGNYHTWKVDISLLEV